jgi:hypothetical protein
MTPPEPQTLAARLREALEASTDDTASLVATALRGEHPPTSPRRCATWNRTRRSPCSARSTTPAPPRSSTSSTPS